jgi:signal transduction histidine kinase
MIRILERQGKVEDYETRFRRKDGSPVWVSLSARGVKDATGRLRHQHVFLMDITERKALETLREDVERIMRHDLKGPLNGLLGVPQLLLQSANLTPDQIELIELIHQTGNRMLAMIESTAAMFQIETGAYQPKADPVDLLAVLHNILQEMAPHLRARRITADISRPEGPAGREERFPVPGDELLLRTMLHNLIKNGAEASPPANTLHITLQVRDGWGLVSIANQGAVPEKIRPRFFDKYVTSGKSAGTGLGTYSARLVATAHGGDIALDCSQPGRTTVTVRLPLARKT